MPYAIANAVLRGNVSAITPGQQFLNAPITKAQYTSSKHGGIPVPDQLFSHSDQQRENMTTIYKSTLTAPTGWAGRLGDVVGDGSPKRQGLDTCPSEAFGQRAHDSGRSLVPSQI